MDSIRGSVSTVFSASDIASKTDKRDSGNTTLVVDKLLARLDRRLLAPLFVMAVFHGFDKNVSHARTMGFNVALGINDKNWSTLLMTYYLGFIFSTIIIVLNVRKSGPATLKCLCAVTAVTGLTTMSNAVAYAPFIGVSWIWIAITRFIQGLCEGTFSAMLVTYLLQFYSATQLADRMLLFFLVPGMSSALGAFYASGCVHWTNAALLNWQLFFLGEGLLTVIAAIVSYCVLPGNASRADFVLEDDLKAALRSNHNREKFSPETILFSELISLRKNPAARNWMLVDVALGVPATIVLLYLPQIILKIGFSVNQANLMTGFPYMTAVLSLILMIRHANDYSKANFISLIFGLQVVGFGLYRLTFSSRNLYMQYVAYLSTFLMAIGIGATNVLAAKHYGPLVGVNEQRLVLNTLGVVLINVTGVITSWVFRAQSSQGEEMTIVFGILGLLISVFGGRLISSQTEDIVITRRLSASNSDKELA